MQSSCPQCSHKIQIDDAKVPDRPFGVKCPKCGNLIRFPGRSAGALESAPAPFESAEPSLPPPPAFEPPAVEPTTEAAPYGVPPPAHRETEGVAPAAGRALVAHPDRGVSAAMTATLTRQGFAVETLQDWEEGARLLEQGVFSLVVTARVGGSQGKESLYQRINRLSSDARRRTFVILVGDEFHSGDGTQAWVCMADLVLHSRDAASADAVVRSTLAERVRLYQGFLDARTRLENAGP